MLPEIKALRQSSLVPSVSRPADSISACLRLNISENSSSTSVFLAWSSEINRVQSTHEAGHARLMNSRNCAIWLNKITAKTLITHGVATLIHIHCPSSHLAHTVRMEEDTLRYDLPNCSTCFQNPPRLVEPMLDWKR